MPYRIFQDSSGVEWTAWDVIPQLAERRVTQRRVQSVPHAGGERRRVERRLGGARRSLLPERLARGWLCFETRAQRRRLSPIPDDWARCADPELERYCNQAVPVPTGILSVHGRRPG